MTLDEVIKLLSISGCNTKIKVLNKLSTTDLNELIEFRNSINERINKLNEKK